MISVIIFDILLPAVHLCLDVSLVYQFFKSGDVLYATATLSVMATPGILEFVNMTWAMVCQDGEFAESRGKGWRTYVYWCVFCIFFPISTIIWHAYHLCKGEKHFKRYEIQATSAVLNSISHMTKAPLQMVLQTTLLMLEWHHHDGFYHIMQPFTIGVSLLFLAKHETDHFFFEVSGKNVNAKFPYRRATKKFLFNIFNISVRVMVISLLAAYLKKVTVAFVGVNNIALFILASLTMRTYIKKNFFSSFAGIIVHSGAFLSRETFCNRLVAEARFRRFSRGNTLIFAVLVVLGMGTLVALMMYNPGNYFSVTCDNMPPLSYNHREDCPKNSPIKDLSKKFLETHQDDVDHRWMILAFLPMGMLVILHVVLVWVE